MDPSSADHSDAIPAPAVATDSQQREEKAHTTHPLQQLGAKLAEARLALGLSLEQLAERLHLGVAQLAALESADRERLPEVVFVIAQARRIAACLGIDVEDELTALRAAPDRQPRRPTLPSGRSRLDDRPPRPRRLPPLPLLLVALAAVGLGSVLLAFRPWSGQRAAPDSRPLPSRVASTSQGRPSASALPAEDVLMLSSRPPSWIAVRDATDTVIFEGQLAEQRSFPLAGGLQVLAGRPDLVLVSRHGQRATPLGPISDVRWRRFAPAGASPAPSPSASNLPEVPAP